VRKSTTRLDGTNPTLSSPLYHDTGVLVDSTRKIEAIATKTGYLGSTMVFRSFVLKTRPATVGSIYGSQWQPATWDRPIYLKLTTPTPKAQIRYTIDSTYPTAKSALYADSLLVDSSRIVIFRVFSGKCQPSEVALQTVHLQTQPVWFGVGGYEWPTGTSDGTGWGPYRFGLASPTPGVAIRYAKGGTVSATGSDDVFRQHPVRHGTTTPSPTPPSPSTPCIPRSRIPRSPAGGSGRSRLGTTR
jgi:hypothetical protein